MQTGVPWLDMLLVIVMLIGAAAGAYSFARNRKTYYDIARDLWKALGPEITKLILKRNTPEVEAKMRDVKRQGGEWDNFRKKERDR